MGHKEKKMNKLISQVSVTFILSVGFNLTSNAQTITFDGNDLPCITYNIAVGFANSQPSLLTRTTDGLKIAANRRAACGSSTAAGKETTIQNKNTGEILFSCDEYPFASSMQGGAGAQAMVVPFYENSSQGGQLSAFYKTNGIINNSTYNVALTNIPNVSALNIGAINGATVCYGID
jgi:hypothetical protein